MGTEFCFPDTTTTTTTITPDVCTNTAYYGEMDSGCTIDTPICVGADMHEPAFGVPGKHCVKCLNVYDDPYEAADRRPDFGCTTSAPYCLNADGSEPKQFWYAGETCNTCPLLNKLDYTSGFDCLSNDSQFKLNGNAKCIGNNTGFLQLTRDARSEVGSAFVPFTFSSCNSAFKFTWDVDYSIYGDDLWQGDGMALVMHQDHRNTSALGSDGHHLGYGSSDTSTSINNAVVVELDTFHNPGDNYMTAIQVVQVDALGNRQSIKEVQNNIRTRTGKLSVKYDGTRLKIYVNNNETPSVDELLNLTSTFQSKQVYVGFTASTGWYADAHEVPKFKFLG